MAEEQKKKDDNVIFVGTKPFMNYITGIAMQFTVKNSNEVIIKARGKFITKAVNLAEVIRKKYLKDRNINLKDIKIGSEELENKDGKKTNVSTIEITLMKN
tara:strand:- start:651 stop:953 length:303 start_codon:yes stop_codon:yes gene_type:complete